MRTTFGLFILLLSSRILSAQCSATTYAYTYDGVFRTSGNTVQGYIETSLDGPCKNDWEPGIEGTFDLGGTVLSQRSTPYWGPAGGYSSWTFPSTTLSVNGPGLYSDWGFHTMHCISSNCGGTGVYAPPYIGGWDGWDGGSLDVQRPSVSAGTGIYGVWWLGGIADGGNFLYNQATLTPTTNCPPADCPETPAWTITQGASKLSLSCSNCSTPTATSQAPSGSVGDIHIKVSIGGFESNTFNFTVNQPRQFVHQSDSDYTVVPTYPTGYRSEIAYTTIEDMYGSPFASIALNESFGTFTDDTTQTGWSAPSQRGIASYSGTWADIMSVWCTGIPCAASPLPVPPQGLNQKVHHGTQTWRVGSSTPGTGLIIQTNVHQRYTDHGRHQ